MILSLQYQYISEKKRNDKKVKISTVGYCLIEHLISSNILFEITSNPCTVIGSHRCDLFKNRTIFFYLDRFFFSVNDYDLLKLK